MKIPFKPIALRAAPMARHAGSIHYANDTTPQVLMATTGQIHLAEYDGTSFTTIMNNTVAGTPSWVEFVEPNKLYAVNEAGTDLRLFHLDIETLNATAPRMTEPVVSAEGSSGVVHLEFNPDQTRMVGAGYGAGTVDIWNVEGEQLKLIKTITSDGELGPVKPNQDAAHPHQSNLDPSGRFFAVNDLGTDEILLIDSQDDAWEVVSKTSTKAGMGPRHGAFFPQGADKATNYMVACELGNVIINFELTYTDSGIDFKEVQTISTFVGTTPDGAAAGELAISSDNANLYVSNRLTGADTDNITRFKIGQDGKLSAAEETSTGGKLPRMFSLGPEGLDIFVGNQNGPDAAVVLGTSEDGAITSEPKATLPLSDFGGQEGFGPQYIKQIR